jgi:hypothetical protein
MYAIYGNIYHQYTPNVSIYTSTMDPMGYMQSPGQTKSQNVLELPCQSSKMVRSQRNIDEARLMVS